MKILSIDAWRDSEGGWTWNQWFDVGSIDKTEFESLKTNRQIIKWFRDNGFITAASAGKVCIDDDQHNIVICQKSNRMPLFAIEYGMEY